ncbi:MAG TPA: hypothetical protein PKD59_00965 [Miltoncostaeaceae bacterium]|nr:hypothetical protein [Miltoncostaeaceae bacterium]
MSSQRYLADTAAAADAVADFSALLSSLAPEPKPAQLRAAAADLAAARDRAARLASRLGAERLEDRRLEAQRADASAALTAGGAAEGDPTAPPGPGRAEPAAAAPRRFSRAVGELRSLPAPS